ncbi:hypothetical protein BDQ12DRAFT_631188 [Crucibulum laeve]|uniref:Dyp-type peroxidase n=1 Tax=Crucibulum laeve TaxID=68775 RepID=A0A5C3M1D2_9AGAR|nr:hypothetical protein BDQ12DRAFT_631188 [Crucibulum laeve]
MATQQPLPAPTSMRLDSTNIQGDILSGLPKKTEIFYFFRITNDEDFRRRFRNFAPLVKSVDQVAKDRDEIQEHKRKDERLGTKPHLIPLVGVNIAFSHLGFKELKIDDTKLIDTAFLRGQRLDAANLGDKGTGSGDNFVPDWEPAFKEEIHGVILVAGDSHTSVNKQLWQIEEIFGDSIYKVTAVRGDARPGDLSAHEHFGYLDGVSNPAIIGFDKNPLPGPAPINPGNIIVGQEGDASKADRAPWMFDGSFLVFRYLFQKVPEFDDFVDKNALKVPGLTHKEGADLLGARLVGRWKSGAPIDLTPFQDDAELGGDPKRNNNFSFAAERDFQKLCPFASHIRKTFPRADFEEAGIPTESHRIMRRGIQFGPEVTRQEKKEKKTMHGRGLLFACYQSSITNSFQLLQQGWANNAAFPFTEKTPQVPGLDAIIGQGPGRQLSGIDPNNPATELVLTQDWVIPRGGEYFFSPSIKSLKDTIALSA